MRHPAAVLVATLTAACGMGENTAARFTTTDSAGVRLQVSTAPQWQDGTGWRLAAEPALQVGALDGPPEYLFDRIGDVRPLDDGGILVVNHGSTDIRIYDPAGAHVRTIGREGGGPGEFEAITSVIVQGDSLLAFDGRLRRISIFGLDGELRSTTPLVAENGRELMVYRLADATPAGYAMIARGGFPSMTNKPGVRRDTLPTVLYDRDGTRRDTIAEYAGTQNFEVPQQIVGQILFASSTSGTARDGEIYMTDGGSMEVRVYDVAEGLVRILRIAEAPRMVSAEEAAASKARALERAAELPASFREALEQFPHAERMPRIQGMLLDDEGNLWVDEYRERSDTTPHTSYIFAPDGRWLGTIQLPQHFELKAVRRGQALGVWQDPDTEVQFVRAYAIIR